MDQEHSTVRLNDELRKRIDLSERELAAAKRVDTGVALLERGPCSPVAFVATSGGPDAIAANVAAALRAAPGLAELERIWIPILGMQASRLSYDQSLQAILAGIASGAPPIRQPTPLRFIVRTDPNIDRQDLLRLRSSAENWAGRTPVGLIGALERLHVSLDSEATAVIDLAAQLALAQRPPLDNGEVGTRSLLFALGGSWTSAQLGMAPIRNAFIQSLSGIAGPRLRERENRYFRDDTSELLQAPTPPPVVSTMICEPFCRRQSLLAARRPGPRRSRSPCSTAANNRMHARLTPVGRLTAWRSAPAGCARSSNGR
jgi:hypothetical protein